MVDANPTFFSRLALGFKALFRALGDPAFAAGIARQLAGQAPVAVADESRKPAPATFKTGSPDAALQILGLLQQEGRFIDFLQEDMKAFADSDIGAAARVVHEGCNKILHEHLSIAPIRTEEEGSKITVSEGFDAASIRITGNVVGKPPFNGQLAHRGWRVTRISLPKVTEGHDLHILQTAEVEL